jgi:Uma2 family endonuclease
MKTMEERFTLKEWNALPEGFPAQLFDGQLVREPSPTYGHQDLVVEILTRLLGLTERGKVVVSPTDVVIDEYNVLQPDVCVLREIPPRDSHDVGIPILVFEVLSPSTAGRDRTVKADKYLAAGVEEVWIVDPAAETIELRTRDGSRVVRERESARSQALPALTVVPADFFRASGV